MGPVDYLSDYDKRDFLEKVFLDLLNDCSSYMIYPLQLKKELVQRT